MDESKESQEPAKIKYTKQLLSLVERQIIEQQQKLNSAEVNLRRLREEQKQYIKELLKIESGAARGTIPAFIPMVNFIDKEE